MPTIQIAPPTKKRFFSELNPFERDKAAVNTNSRATEIYIMPLANFILSIVFIYCNPDTSVFF